MKKQAIWLTDGELVEAVRRRAKADSRTVAAVAGIALREYLNLPTLTGTPADAPPQPKAQTAKAPQVRARLIETPKQQSKPVDVHLGVPCGRCGHGEEKHTGTAKSPQLRCNVMSCACARFQG